MTSVFNVGSCENCFFDNALNRQVHIECKQGQIATDIHQKIAVHHFEQPDGLFQFCIGFALKSDSGITFLINSFNMDTADINLFGRISILFQLRCQSTQYFLSI
jgi:hypothetical protein